MLSPIRESRASPPPTHTSTMESSMPWLMTYHDSKSSRYCTSINTKFPLLVLLTCMMTQVTMYLKGFWSLVRLARQDSTTPLVHWFTLACCTRRAQWTLSTNYWSLHYRVTVASDGRLYGFLDHVGDLVHHELCFLGRVITHLSSLNISPVELSKFVSVQSSDEYIISHKNHDLCSV